MVKKKKKKKKKKPPKLGPTIIQSIRVSWVYIHALQENRRYALRKMLYLKYM